VVSGLTRGQFQILDNDEPRPILSFERTDAPMSVVFVVDTSASMRSKIARARAALLQIAAIAGPEDEAALITFSDRPQVRAGFTREIDRLVATVGADAPAGDTALIDAVEQALQVVRNGRNPRRAIIVISDGGDNHSRHTATELLNAALESDAQIYGIAIHEQMFSAAERCGSDLLDRLSLETGGLSIEVRSSKQLPDASQRIGEAIRNLYVVGFKPPEHCRMSGRRRIRVRVEDTAGRRLRVSARPAYVRPAAE
jgi:Ca-activated chloride channel family protein